MAKNKLMSVVIDLGASLTKIIGICDGVMISVVMSPEVIEIDRSTLDGQLNSYGKGAKSPRATVEYCFVGVNDRYYAVGDLAQRFGAFQRFKPLKIDAAVYKILAGISILAHRFELGQKYNLSIGCLLPPGELADCRLLEQQLISFLPHFDSPLGMMNVKLVGSCFHPEGAGILELYQNRQSANPQSKVGVFMAGHRNLTCYVTKNGVVSDFASCDLGFHNWVKEVVKRTSGYKLEDLSVAIAKYWLQEDKAALQPILRQKEEQAAEEELARLIQVLESTNEIYCQAIFNWLDEYLPSDLEEVMISGGAADVLRDELVYYFDRRLPSREQLDGKTPIYYSDTGFNLPKLDVPAGCQSRMADVYCLWEYLMPKPQPKSVINQSKITTKAG